MKTGELVALTSIDSGSHRPFEYVFGVIDAKGVLHQLAGTDEEIALELVSMAKSGVSIFEQTRKIWLMEEERLKFERGDTPEMPRQPAWQDRSNRRPLGTLPAGEEAPPVAGLGQKPIVESKDETSE